MVIAEVPTGWWAKWDGTRARHRGAEYDALKLALQSKLLALLIRRFPQLDGRLRAVNLGTPLSTKYYLNKEEGESYGMQPSPNFFKQQELWLRPTAAGVANLYLAGQDVNFDGFAGALMSGIICAASIEGIGVWLDVVRSIGVQALVADMLHGQPDLTERYRPKAAAQH